jgi:hypothetical protein
MGGLFFGPSLAPSQSPFYLHYSSSLVIKNRIFGKQLEMQTFIFEFNRFA